MIKAILFDLDGVLVDMVEAHYEALNKALHQFGTEINRQEQQTLFNGLPTRKKIEELEKQGRLPLGLREQINSIKQQYTKEIIPKYCTPDHSKILMLEKLKKQGFKLACCSNSIKETLHLMLKSAQLYEHFDLVIGNDEIKNPKPDPEIYTTTCRRLDITPAEALIIEDSPYGVRSAMASGANVIVVKGVYEVNLGLFTKILARNNNEKVLA